MTSLADLSLYVMTPEFGAASQLEKIEMLDLADIVAINKFDRKGGEDALRDVRKELQRNRKAFAAPPESFPVYGTIASRFNDDGVTALYHGLLAGLTERGFPQPTSRLPAPLTGRRRPAPASCRRRARAISPRSPRRCAATTPPRPSRRAWRARRSSSTPRRRLLSASGGDGAPAANLAAERRDALDQRARRLLETWP